LQRQILGLAERPVEAGRHERMLLVDLPAHGDQMHDRKNPRPAVIVLFPLVVVGKTAAGCPGLRRMASGKLVPMVAAISPLSMRIAQRLGRCYWLDGNRRGEPGGAVGWPWGLASFMAPSIHRHLR